MIEYDSHSWTHHLLDIKGSVIRQVFWRVALFVIWSVVVVLFHEYVRPVHVPTTVHTLIGVALGLLLVFRTNASYERFWEGRRMWGGIEEIGVEIENPFGCDHNDLPLEQICKTIERNLLSIIEEGPLLSQGAVA